MDRKLCVERLVLFWRLAQRSGVVSAGEECVSAGLRCAVHERESDFLRLNVGDAWPQERDRPASNLATGNAGENAGMARITLARHKYSAGGTSVPSRNYKNTALPGAINLVFFDGHAELAANEKLWQFRWHKNWKTPAQRPR